jgi:hypothetical protein
MRRGKGKWARAAGLAFVLWCAPAAAAPASAALLRVLYPGFDTSGYRAQGRRIGWTQVQAWKARPGTQVVLVEKLEGEGSGAPPELELAVMETTSDGPRVVARRSGWRHYRSSENCPASCTRRMVGLDLVEFAFCPGEVGLGVVTEKATLRELELFRLNGSELVSLVRIPVRERAKDGTLVSWTPTLMLQRGQSCRNLKVTASGSSGSTRLFQWNGERYVEEGGAVAPATDSGSEG